MVNIAVIVLSIIIVILLVWIIMAQKKPATMADAAADPAKTQRAALIGSAVLAAVVALAGVIGYMTTNKLNQCVSA